MQTLTITSNDSTFDWSLGSNGYLSNVSDSIYYLSMSNFPTASNSAYDLTILYSQGGTATICVGMNVNNASVSRYCFSNDTQPTPTRNQWEIQKFKIFYFDASNVVVLTVFETYCSNSAPE
jgi:hypothetical protein